MEQKLSETVEEIVMSVDCKSCKHSDNGKCAYTEECNECMWKSQYETQPMSREEMIDTLKGLVFGTFDRTTAKEREALDLAIKVLELQTCDDCISREEVIKLLEKEDWADTVTGVLALPLKKPQRKPGHWKWELASNGWANHICSECGFKENTDIHVKLNWKFCPRCGAEMEVNDG